MCVFFIGVRVFLDLGSNESYEKGRKETICIFFHLCDTLYTNSVSDGTDCHP